MTISEDNLLLASLSGVQCPFEKDTSVMLCSFYEHNYYCPFAHKTDSLVRPIMLPPFTCLNHLVGQCKLFPPLNITLHYHKVCNDCHGDSGELKCLKWKYCLDGFHLNWMELLEIDTISTEIMKFKRELDQSRQLAQLPDHKCAICLDIIESRCILYGLPKDCCHIFCAGCLFRWISNGRNTCPTCRTLVPNALAWFTGYPIPEGDDKRNAFLLDVNIAND